MTGLWLGDTRCVVSLGFDVDGVSGAINRNPNAAHLPTLMSMREYGPSVATPRILDVLGELDVRASFFVPGYVAETHPELVEDIGRRGHEVGHHGYMHEPPATLSKDREAEVLDKGIEIIERIIGAPPKGYRSPSWELSEHSLSLLAERGFVYDSSLMGDDVPYMVDADGTRIVEVPVHWELDDFPYYAFDPALGLINTPASPAQVFEAWSAAFEGAHHYGRSFVLTLHPFVSGRPGRLRMLERLIGYIRGFPGVRFMTALELAETWRRSVEQ